MNILTKPEKEKILFALRKIGEDFNKVELIMESYSQRISHEHNLRLKQFFLNNKNRIKNIIWSITSENVSKEIKKDDKKKVNI